MTEPNQQEQLTTADLAGRRSNFAENSYPHAETWTNERGEGLSASKPGGPKFVPKSSENAATADSRPEVMKPTPDPRKPGDWNTLRPATPTVNKQTDEANATSLLSESDITDLRSRWNDVQAEFVDEPRRSVEQADQLVATVMQRLAEGFANERASLEKQWDSGDSVSTEELRVALQRYRAFFGRLLHAA